MKPRDTAGLRSLENQIVLLVRRTMFRGHPVRRDLPNRERSDEGYALVG